MQRNCKLKIDDEPVVSCQLSVVSCLLPVASCQLTTNQQPTTNNQQPATSNRQPPSAFTLVEMLVVIVIIGVLAGLVLPAINAARERARVTRIVMEISNLHAAMQDYRNTYGSYPPNFSDVNAVVRHFKKAFPRIASTELLLVRQLANPTLPDALVPPLTPAEALVFWLGGFSSNPEFPLTGPGGPLYEFAALDEHSHINNLNDRTFRYEFNKAVLADNETREFTMASGNKVILFAYPPEGFEEPLVYYDTSRAGIMNSAGLANAYVLTTAASPGLRWESAQGAAAPLYRIAATDPDPANPTTFEFVNADSFQILHSGTDDDWGSDAWNNATSPPTPNPYPNGPFTGEMADNLANFATGALEDAGE